MNRKSIVLMIGAVAAGLQAASQKTQNPNAVVLLVFAGVALAFFADPPRDPGSRERVADHPVEGAKPVVNQPVEVENKV